MINKEELLELTESYLKSLISEVTELVIEDDGLSTPFQELGIDSFRVLQIIKKLEEIFGTLPKTLLFENFNINDLSNYFITKYEAILLNEINEEIQKPRSKQQQQQQQQQLVNVSLPKKKESSKKKSHRTPILILEKELQNHPEIENVYHKIFNQYKNEGSASRGTRNIAPNLFIGSEKRGYFNYCRDKNLVLVYSYTGSPEYFSEIANEMDQYCSDYGLELSLFTDDNIKSINNTPYFATPFGIVSRIVNIKEFSLKGNTFRRLRYSVSKFKSAGKCKTEEYKTGTNKNIDKNIASIIDQWCEPRTMVNPLIHIVKEEVLAGKLSDEHRLFLTYLDDVLQNVILISSLSSEMNGYLMDLEFYPKDMPYGGLEFGIINLIEKLAAEGCDVLSLGGTYGCKLESSPNADPTLDKTLAYLREQNIFNDEGNLQFKNKFRPEHKTIYLCSPKGTSNSDNVTDIIMMIADPFKEQNKEGEQDTYIELSLEIETETQETKIVEQSKVIVSEELKPNKSYQIKDDGKMIIEGEERSAILAEFGYNPLNIPNKHVEFDLKTDSWAQLEMPSIKNHSRYLYTQIQQQVDIDESLKTVFPFSHIALTTSGRNTEHAFFKTWHKKGKVIQNLLFPTTIFHQIENGFTPKELPHNEIFNFNSKEVYKGNLDFNALQKEVEKDSKSIALVIIEVSDNASGGFPVSIAHLKEVKSLLTKYSIPLVIEGTRILENAQFIIENEKEYSKKNIWEIAREIFSYSDAVIVSLAKDFCVTKGGLIATNDTDLFNKLQNLILEEGIGLDVIDKKLIALSFNHKNKIEAQVQKRINSVRLIGEVLKEKGIPIVQPTGGHCLLIDVKQITEFKKFKFSVASFIAWMYQNTGIRAGEHSVGMQKNTAINNMVRLAIPVGLKRTKVDEIIKKLIQLFDNKKNIPEIELEGNIAASIGDIHSNFKLKCYHQVTANIIPKTSLSKSKEINKNEDISSQNESVTSQNVDRFNQDSQKKKSNQLHNIAIVGMSGRYPKANNMSEFWENLVDGRDCIELIPDERFEQRLKNKFSEKYRGGFIDCVDKFDSLFFNISPREAEYLDPQERLFLEVAWEAIEDAGYYPETLGKDASTRNIGVFVGAVWTLYQMLGVEEKFKGNNLNPSSHLWGIANRVSYAFNLSGPSLSVDTACSSSLTALYLACEAIRNGECKGAIVGGVNLDVHQSKIDINTGGGALSEDGVCRTFGKGANGYVAGEGVGAIFLKPLDDAINDGDNIYGVIKGIGVNHGGKTSGFMVPSPRSQASVITTALKNANIDARTIGYIEAHGTGTELGDPIEINGLTTAFENYNVDLQSCSVGSVKTNIGHLEAAAGIVGIHKVLLQMKYKKLIPSLHSSELNPFIEFDKTPFYVEQTLEDWKPKVIDGVEFPLRAGISSFGAGGANAHIIIEEYVDLSLQEAIENHPQLEEQIFPISARNEGQLRESAIRLRNFIQNNIDNKIPTAKFNSRDIAHTLRVGRKSFEYRLVIIAKTNEELVEKLDNYIDGVTNKTIIVGKAKNNDGIAKLLNRKEKGEFIKLLYKSGDSRKLAQVWIEGVFSDWQGIEVLHIGKKVSLPTYPFADKRHWISDASEITSVTLQKESSIHPLIDSNESTFERQIFKKTFHENDFFIYDHLVSDVPTLPGVAYLDFARKAGEIALGRKVQKIKNILWLSPITVVDSIPIDVFIELIPKGELIQFEVFSEKEDGGKQLHSQGKIAYATTEELEAEAEFIALEDIQARCNNAVSIKDAYPQFKSFGLDLGPSFQVLQEVYQNKEEILGILEIPQARQVDFQDYLLHPSLIDGTGQTGMIAQLSDNESSGSGEMYVPYSFGEVEILHPLTQRCFAYIKKANDPNAVVTKTDIIVVDEDGKVLVKIKDSVGVPLVSVHEKPEDEEVNEEFEKLYYAPIWEKTPLVAINNQKENNHSIVFFDIDNKLSNQYINHLKKNKDVSQTVILVKLGDSFKELGENTYSVNPKNSKDYTQLFESLNKSNLLVAEICFTWSLNQYYKKQSKYSEKKLKDVLQNGVYSMLLLTQALIEQKYKNNIQLQYLYLSKEDELQPHNDAMNGFAKTLNIEYSKISCKILEIQQKKSNLKNISEIISTEFNQDSSQGLTVRYQEQERYTRKLQEYKLDATENQSADQPFAIKEKGAYLITGGAGGLGLIFAQYLAKEFKARLVLTGRSELSEDRKATIDELKNLGAEVTYFPADVSKQKDVNDLIKLVKSEYGAINGIIHSAGVLRDSYIKNKKTEDLDDVFAPKLFGAHNLDEATQNEELDFFVMFSSMAAVSGNIGQCDYSFANNFMDSFASHREQLRERGKRIGKTLSINWSIWADGGMRLDKQTEIYFKNSLGINPLSKETGLTAFTKGLHIVESQLAVVEGDQDKIEIAWGLRQEETKIETISEESQPVNSSQESSATATSSNGNKDLMKLVEGELSQIVMDFLKLDEEDIDEEKILMDLGFDSIGLATFANSLNDKYGLEDITPVLFFEYPSIREIAKFLCTDHIQEIQKLYQLTPDTKVQTEELEKTNDVQDISIGFKKKFNLDVLESTSRNKSSGANFSAERRFSDMPIAIVGMSGVMPQADNIDEYWEKLKNAKNNMVTLVPEDRWKWEDYYGDPFEEKNKTKIKYGGFMREVDKFDPHFWGISPREAVMMDPQQRIFLETVWSAIEDSGHKVSELSGTKTGLFVGAATRDYIDLMGSLDVELDGYSGSGTSHAVLANRVSFLLNLHGPSAPLDTACSSSLVALHRAIESIHTGSSEMAIVGGVQVILTPAGHISFGAAGMLSEDGKCKTFDDRANGYVRGEGSGAIFIKPLARAEADGDHIYAVIKSTAENHGGKATILTAPNPKKQAELLVEAYEKAEIDPTTVGYIECHGTGTSLGDPIEIQALKRAFSELYKRHNKPTAKNPHIGLTSAKTNIGHLETAAGIAGILKVLLSIKNRQIPALLHFEKLNPFIKLDNTPFYMVDKTRPWETIKDENGNSFPLRAGVSSFGFGGANVHIVLEEYIPTVTQSLNEYKNPYLIVLSAKKEERLIAYAQLILDYVTKNEIEMVDVAYTLQVGRDVMDERLGLIVNTKDELIEKLTAFTEGRIEKVENVYRGKKDKKNNDSDIDENTISNWLTEKNNSKLLESWVIGSEIDWSMLYDNIKPKRISLPTYPFAKERYWFRTQKLTNDKLTPVTKAVIHPLVHTNTSDLSLQSYSSTFNGEEFFIKDYQNEGQIGLPSAAFLEMARVAVENATPQQQKSGILELQNITCEKPIPVNSEKTVNIELFVNDYDEIEFEITGGKNDEETIYGNGQAIFTNISKPANLPIRKLMGQMRLKDLSINTLYEDFAKKGVNYGPSFQAITAIYERDQQILVQFKVQDDLVVTLNQYVLHPSIMECITQASIGLLTSGFSPLYNMMLPPSLIIESIRVLSTCTQKMYAWIRLVNDKVSGIPTNLDIDLCDEQGNLCVQMRGFSIKPIGENAMQLDNNELVLPEVSFNPSAPTKPQQVQLLSLDDTTTLMPVEHQTIPTTTVQQPLEPIIKPVETNQSTFNQELGQTKTELQQQLIESLAESLYLDISEIDINKSFIDLGMDSIVGVEWLNTINKQFKMTIPASVVYDYPNIKKLASFLYEEMSENNNDNKDESVKTTSLSSQMY